MDGPCAQLPWLAIAQTLVPSMMPAVMSSARPERPPCMRLSRENRNIPAAATKGLTVTSAEAFARFYLAAVDHLVSTGDASSVRQWSLPTCVACKAFADSYEKTYRSGGAVTGDNATQITRVASSELAGKGKAKVVFNAKAGATTWRPSATASPTPLPGGKQRWEFYLNTKDGQWITYEINLVE